MVLKHATWDAILFGEGRLKSSEREEFKYLQARVDPDRVREILVKNLPYLDLKLFEHCLQVLRPGCPLVKRIQTGHRLQICLGPFARRPLAADTLLKIGRRAAIVIRRRIFKSKSKYRLAGGGAMIAILGGDGSGKSTAVKGLRDWLSKDFDTAKGHMGKPPWSLTTYLIRGILKVGSLSGLTPPTLAFGEMQKRKTPIPPEYPWLLREICTARDRYRAYRKAWAFSNDGGIVFLDRFPHPQTQRMDGPRGRLLLSQQSGPLIRRLIWLEERYYRPIVPPELVIVLRVDPEIAVQRKADENPAFVRERAMEIWQVNWENTGVHVIDAGKSKAEVLAELKALVWAHL